jgi:hypothetical protein
LSLQGFESVYLPFDGAVAPALGVVCRHDDEIVSVM